VAVDTPFSGALVPARHYRRDPRVQSVMVEVNRRLYLDEATGLPAKGCAEGPPPCRRAALPLCIAYNQPAPI
jgi:hypothetical protein